MSKSIVPCLWFDNKAEEAVRFYLSIFKDGKVLSVDRYTEVGEDITGHKGGDVLTIEFELLGSPFLALNGGPEFAFSPAVSFTIECSTQEEIDYYWDRLSAQPEAEQCGWLRDKYGLSWQVVPARLSEMLKSGTPEQRKRVTEAFMEMKKFDLAALEEAYAAR